MMGAQTMGKPIKTESSMGVVPATSAQPGAGDAGSEVQQEQAFATGISRPQPAQPGAVAGAAGSEVQQEQAFATGISRPQPAQP
jgi:hypothetical protein